MIDPPEHDRPLPPPEVEPLPDLTWARLERQLWQALDAPAAPAPPPATAPAPPVAIAPPSDPGDPVPPPAASAVPFDQEQRDPAWAVDQERELKLRLDRVAADLLARGATVTVAAAECRRTLCRIDLEATDNAGLSAFYGALETPEGLYGWADQIVLQDVESDLTSREVRTRVLVQFDRD